MPALLEMIEFATSIAFLNILVETKAGDLTTRVGNAPDIG
jgi:hypothetical protein